MDHEMPPAAPEQMADPLSAEEVRVLGCLIEKSFTTPDVYPMTVNALVAACNQKSSRFPVVQYEEDTVRRALDRLRDTGWVVLVRTAGARTLKYKHQVRRQFEFSDREVAVLCVLMLRGPQTTGEIRARTERMAGFDSLAEVEETVRELATGYPHAFLCELPRQPGQKDIRFAHRLSGEPMIPVQEFESELAPSSPASDERLDALEEQVRRLQDELAALKIQFDVFRRQFE
jgi:uncharacterized protein YceH (UPF0502 family)